MTKKIQLTITEDLKGLRLDQALSHHSEIKTRNQAQKLIKDKKVFLKNKIIKNSEKVSLKEVYDIFLKETKKISLFQTPLKSKIFFQDEDIIVVNKPAGLVTHPAVGHEEESLVHQLFEHLQNNSIGKKEHRPGVVHRLDKDVSGLLVFAKNDTSYLNLVEQFKLRTVHRIYWAITYGLFKETEGSFSSYFIRHPKDRKKYISEKVIGEAKGKQAITHYKVLENLYSAFSIVQCQLETGRTHQIRIHLSEKTHGILGDLFYGNPPKKLLKKNLQIIKDFKRLALHGKELGFTHPRTKKSLLFQCPWPSEIENLIQELK